MEASKLKENLLGEEDLKVLLIGNPNVGKSVIFSKLTGVDVDCSNFAGTTVDYTRGNINFLGNKGVLIDLPGIYSLDAKSEAEEVAVSFLNQGADLIICVLDGTHLERNLDLALQIKSYGIPTIYSLNLMDVAERQGIEIDTKKLSKELAAPVIPTIAIRNLGLREVIMEGLKVRGKPVEIPGPLEEKARYKEARRISQAVERRYYRKASFMDKLEDWTVQPWPGIPIAILVLIISLGLVVGGGKGLRSLVLLPLVNGIIKPGLTYLVSLVVPVGIFRNLLVGEFGIFIIGIEWPFALILPYVFFFYLVFSFLEDSGYLPRLGVLADGLLRKFGIQGGNIISLMMGYGCAVPAIIGTRAANTYKERLMVATMIAFSIPCASQTGAFIALLGERSILALVLVYLISFLSLGVVGLIMNKSMGGESQPMLLEVPNLLLPNWDSFKTKLKIRMKHFLLDAEGPMMIGIVIAAIVAETGILNSFSSLIAPLVENWLGLPREASLSLLLGIVRRELAVLPLLELELSTLQLLVGSVVALFYLPCLSVFGVLMEEFSPKVAIAIGISTTLSALFFAGLINQVGSLILGLVS